MTDLPHSDKSTTGHALKPLPIRWPVRWSFRALSALWPGAASLAARRLFFAPWRTPLRDSERQILARGQSFSIESRGQKVHATSWGRGPVVLLVHGWAGHAGQMTELVAPLTAAGFRVVAADMPGHGQSGGKLSSVVHFAEAMRHLDNLLGPLRGLVAHSFGAAASTYALSLGLTAERAVFVAPPARFDSFWTRFGTGLGMSERLQRRMTADAEAWLGLSFEGAAPVQIAPGMTTPLLILHDVGDREVPYREGAELAAAWPGAALHRTEQLGHLRILRDPATLATLVDFLVAPRAAAAYSTVTRKNLTELSSFTSIR